MIKIETQKQLEVLHDLLEREAHCEGVDISQNNNMGITLTFFESIKGPSTAQYYIKMDGKWDQYREPLDLG